MEIQTNISHPVIIITLLLALAASLPYALYFYRKNTDEFNTKQRIALSLLRFIGFFLISFLLLAPVTELIRNRIEKPLIILGIDNSESMAKDSINAALVESFIDKTKTSLSDKYKVETFLFGDKVRQSDSISFTDLWSNYSNFFLEIEKRYFNLNVGAIVLVGDGIYNQGKNPEQLINNINVPVYTLGVGDTLSVIDQAIIDVTHNPNVFKGNVFPIEVELNFTNFPFKQSQISIFIDGKLTLSDKVEVLQPNFYFRNIYNISINEIGLKNVSILVSPIKEEQNTRNNRLSFTIEVHDNRKEILVLTQGPHPDIGIITQTLNQKANYNVTTTPIGVFTGSIKNFDLVVLNQLPSLRSQNHEVYKAIKDEKKSVLVIVGPNTSLSTLNNLELGFSITPSLLTENSEPFFNESFSLFSLPVNIKNMESIYPPLITPFSEYKTSSDFSILAYQKIKGIEMNYPLIMAGTHNDQKIGAITGEGIWRWSLREFQNFENQNAFNQIIVNIFSFLTLKEEREQFKIAYERISTETSPYQMKAQVFNEIFEPVGNAEVRILISDSIGKQMRYLFDVNQTEYNLNMGLLSPGKYQFEATALLGENEFVKTGGFSIQEVNIEQQNLQSNFKTLSMLSNLTGGKFHPIDEANEVISMLNQQKELVARIHKEKNIHELIDWKYYVLFVILLFTLEWFLRKFWGSY